MRTNAIRFTGLASGLDTESLVNAMLMPHQNKIDSQKQKQTLLNWKKDAWKDINNKVSTLYTKYIDKLRLQSTFEKNKITSSNTNALDIDLSSSIPAGTHEIGITQIASGAYMKNSAMTGGSTITENTTLEALGIKSDTTIGVQKLDIDGKPTGEIIKIELKSSMKLADINKQLQEKGTNLNLSVNSNKVEISSTKSGAENTVKIMVVNGNTDPDGEFIGDSMLLNKLGFSSSALTMNSDGKVEGKDFSIIDKDTRLSLLVKSGDNQGQPITFSSVKININGKPLDLSNIQTIGDLEKAIKQADPNLNVNFDVTNQRFFISTKETGKDAKINITGENLDLIGLQHNGTGENTLEGKDALYIYNGMNFESASNEVTVNGIKMTIKDKTTEPIKISATKDTSEVTKFVKEFVEEYNKLIDEINTKVEAKKSYTYTPLTDEKKKEMSEDDIKLWEDKAKEGIFSGDRQLANITSTLRNVLGSTVEGGGIKVLSQVGISTGNWKDKGKLVFDEKKFQEALEKNPDDVINLFTGGGNEEEAKKAYLANNPGGNYDTLSKEEKDKYLNPTKGIMTRMYSEFTTLMKSSTIKSYGSFYNDKAMDEELEQIRKKIEELDDKYVTLENNYYAKFATMEKMMSQLNNQSSWLTSQLGGM